jgi:prepilin-type N-terminal cleavage/methylation domain-containing protein
VKISTTKLRVQGGFSMIELVIVIAIGLVIAALAFPSVTRAAATFRLRQSVSGVAGIFQKARIEAVRTNRIQVIRAQLLNNAGIVYVDGPGTQGIVPPYNQRYDRNANPAEALAQLGQGVQPEFNTPPPQAFPSALLLNINLAPSPGPMAAGFNPRGLPCAHTAPGTCDNGALNFGGFLYYFRLASPFGDQWSALTVTPAGRVRVWMWNGTNWN